MFKRKIAEENQREVCANVYIYTVYIYMYIYMYMYCRQRDMGIPGPA